MAQPTEVTGLLRAASRADNLPEIERLVGEVETARTASLNATAAQRELDLANAILADHLTPVRVHEHHTAATDWVGSVDTTGGAGVQNEMVAQGSVWYSNLHLAVRSDQDEFEQQAVGMGRRLAGAYGEQADVAEQTFLTHVGTLWSREARAGMFVEAASGVPQIGEPGAPVAEATVGPPAATGLPLDMTTSERAPMIQAMEQNTGGGGGPVDPVLDQSNPDSANGDEGDRTDDKLRATTSSRRTADGMGQMIDSPFTRNLGREIFGDGSTPGGMQDRPPTLNDHGKHLYQVQTWHHGPDGEPTAHSTHEMRSHRSDVHDDVEQAAWEDHASRHGVDRNSVEVGPAMRMDPDGPKGYSPKTYTATRKESSMQTATCPSCKGHGKVAVRTQAASGLPQIQEIVDSHDNAHGEQPWNEQVAFPWEMDAGAQQNAIAETEQQLAEREQRKGANRQQIASRAAQMAYRHVMRTGGQDLSGWAGDMGAGGVRPGMQDQPGPGPIDSLPYVDPVYGQGGDQGDKDLKPYGADEANDVTNNPGMNWQPGQPTQYDQAARPNSIGQPTATLQVDANLLNDPEIARAYRFLQARAAHLTQR